MILGPRVWPPRPLLLLTAVVLLVHGLVLSGAAAEIRPAGLSSAPWVFATRTLAAVPAPPATEPGPPVTHAGHAAAPERLPRIPPLAATEADPPALTAQLAPAPVATTSAPVPLAAPPGRSSTQAASAVAAVHVPASTRLRYKVSAQARGIPVSGQGELSWRHDGADYEAQMQISALFMPTRTQRSTGRITAEGIEPTRFSDRTRSEEAAHFERDKGKIIFSANRPEVALLPGAQDRLTVLLQLGALVAGDPRRYPAGTSMTLQTASTRDADLWKFTVEGVEELQLPGGRLQTLRLQRAPRHEFDQKVELWLAPAQEYLPVRLRLTQPNGDSVDQEWISTERG